MGTQYVGPDIYAMKSKYIPTSLYAPVSLERPLKLFGKDFSVEISTPLTLGPDTVLRAAIGKSMTWVLRKEGLLQPLKQFSDGMLGKHKLSGTTKKKIASYMGSLTDPVMALMNGGPVPEELKMPSDWSTLAASWDLASVGATLGIIVNGFIQQDQLGLDVLECYSSCRQEAGEEMLASHFEDALVEWRGLCPSLNLKSFLLIETSMRVLAQTEHTMWAADSRGKRLNSRVERYLQPGAKPLGHWLREVTLLTKCDNYKELADRLFSHNICHKGSRVITHDTLKAWSAMRPRMLMSLEGCQSLLEVVPDRAQAESYLARFAVGRFLAFMCDFLLSCSRDDSLSWSEAQEILLKRYIQLLAAHR